jgi:predicted Zn-dependent protease
VYTVQRDFANAESALRRAIQANPAVSRAYAMLAGVLVSAGKLEAARTEFDRLAQQNPKDIAAPTMSAMILQAQNKTAEAKKRYEAIVGENPTAAVASNNLAWIYAEEGDKLDDALRLAQSAAARMPDNPEVQDTIGWIYYKKELPALAVSAFEKSVEKSPENPLFLYHLALALDKAGDSKRARETVLRAVKVRPDYPEAQKLLAQLKG